MSSGKSFRLITTGDKSFRPITTADKSFRPITRNEFETDEAADKSFRPITTKEFETDEAANNEVKGIIRNFEDEQRQAREAEESREQFLLKQSDEAARILREYHKREKEKEQGLCRILGGKIKNTFQKKNKSKRGNKRFKKNKRYSRKYSRKYSSKSSSKSLKK